MSAEIMKKVSFVIIGSALLLLNWAALHDILKDEPNPYAEYAIIAVSILVLTAFIISYRKVGKKKGKARKPSLQVSP